MLQVQTRSVEQVLIDLRRIARELSAKDPRAERIARMISELEETVAHRARLETAQPAP
jgi:HAMP domain-containing protein